MRPAAYVAVIGAGEATADELASAESIGAGLADLRCVVVTGGLGGVMEAACRGARSRRGHTLGLLPGEDRADANGWVEIAVPTGLGELRNALVIRAADAVIAVGGGPGTLSEIGFALKWERLIVGVGTWEVHGVEHVDGPREALDRIARHLSLATG